MRKFLSCLLRFTLIAVLSAAGLAQSGGELRFCLRAEPKSLNPLLASTEPDETVRYLTGGVLVRMNRSTQDVRAGAGERLEGQQWQQDDYLHAAGRPALLRRHAFFCR